MFTAALKTGGRKPTRRSHNNNAYQTVQSNRQIRTIITKGTPADVAAVIATLIKKVPVDARQRLMRLIIDGTSDAVIYNEISRWRHKYKPGASRAGFFADDYAKKIKPFLPDDVGTYCDIGGGDGTITALFGKAIGAKRIINIDVLESGGTVEYFKADETNLLPYADGSVDVITAFQSLHHIVNVSRTFQEIKRILAPGGVCLIKEHDCWTPFQAMTIDVEHLIYMICDEGFTRQDTYFINLFNRESLPKAMVGLQMIFDNFYYTTPQKIQRPDRAFWAVFKHESTPQEEPPQSA